MNFHDKPPLLPIVFKAENWIGGQGIRLLPFTKGVPWIDAFSKPHMPVQKYALQSPCSGGRLWLGVFETPFLVDRGMGFFSDFFLKARIDRFGQEG